MFYQDGMQVDIFPSTCNMPKSALMNTMCNKPRHSVGKFILSAKNSGNFSLRSLGKLPQTTHVAGVPPKTTSPLLPSNFNFRPFWLFIVSQLVFYSLNALKTELYTVLDRFMAVDVLFVTSSGGDSRGA